MSYTQEGVMAQIFVAFGQGTGVTRVSPDAAEALRALYFDAITADIASTRWSGEAVLERIRALGRLAAFQALQRGDTVVSAADVQSLLEKKAPLEVEPNPVQPGRGTFGDARFPVPSHELTLFLVNVPLSEWASEDGRSSEEVINDVTRNLQGELADTLADCAFSAIERGDTEVEISVDGRFGDSFARELMRTLPIDPYVAPEVLKRLHSELIDIARSRAAEAGWGRLATKDGGLVISLSLSAVPQSAVAQEDGATAAMR